MTPTPITPPAPLSPEQLRELEGARLRVMKVRRAATVATTDSYITSFFAACAILSGFCGIDALLLGLAMAAVAYNGFRGARMLRLMDIRAPKLLALNQVWLFVAITLYATYNWYMLASGRNSSLNDFIRQNIGDTAQLGGAPGVAEAVDRIKRLLTWLPTMLYGGLIAGSLLGQGLTGLYYYTRRARLQEYIGSTPPWILELQRRGLA